MIAVVDSGIANLASVMAALQRLRADAQVTADHALIARATHVILPGVGAAKAAMANLHDKGLIEPLRALTQPVLGICLGMQILFDSSEEGGGVPCLGVIPDTVSLLPASTDCPIPHMGWNQIEIQKPEHPLLLGVENGAYAYFVHSFAAGIGTHTVASTTYGRPFTALASYNNFMGCQFHPERSGKVGSLILSNFLKI